MIQGAQLFSKGTSHGSTIHDCDEPSKLQSTLSEDRVLPPPSANGSLSGQASEADPGFRAPARHKLPTFAICATAIESRCQAYFSRYSGRDGVHRCQEPPSRFKASRFGEIASRACRR